MAGQQVFITIKYGGTLWKIVRDMQIDHCIALLTGPWRGDETEARACAEFLDQKLVIHPAAVMQELVESDVDKEL